MTFFIDDESTYEIGSLHLLERHDGGHFLVEIISSNTMQLYAYRYALLYSWNRLSIAYDYKIKNNNIVLKINASHPIPTIPMEMVVKLSIPYSTEPDINVKIDNALKYIHSTFNP
jgi:hypothetical protein